MPAQKVEKQGSDETRSAGFYPLLVKATAYAYSLNWFSYITADPDLWGHIKFGGEIWSRRALPETDIYSYTAYGLPWTNHEWLSEVLFYLVYSAFGSTGLLAFKALVGLTVVHILTSIVLGRSDKRGDETPSDRGRAYLIYLVVVFLAAPAIAPGFMVRPHLFTILFLAVLLAMLHDFLGSDAMEAQTFPAARPLLAWSPLLTLVWANCHGGVVAGMGVYGAAVAAETLRSLRGGGARGRQLSIYFGLSCLALLLNPYGYKLWIFWYRALALSRPIGEWEPIAVFGGGFLQFKILVLLFLAGLLAPAVRKRAWEIAVVLPAVVYGFKHQRHSVLTAVVLAPCVFFQLAQAVKMIDAGKLIERFTPAFHETARAILVLFVAFQLHGAFFKHRSNHFKILVEPGVYPSYAARFMIANGIDGNVLTPFDWGEYLIWKLPRSKVSIDGRFETVYPEDVVRKTWDFAQGKPGWRKMLEDYPTEIVLARKSDNTHLLIGRDGGWAKIYEDPLCALFVRDGSPPGSILEKFHDKRLLDPPGPPSFEFP